MQTDQARLIPTGEEHSPQYIWYMVFLLTIVNVFNYMDRMALSVLLPLIKADLRLSDGQLGLLIGVAFSIFYSICGVPIARWADRGVRRDIIAIALAIWSVMTAVSGAAQNFWHLFAARVGVGAGEAGGLPPAQSIICDHVPLRRRPGIFAIHNFGLCVGMMLGMALSGWLGETIGWRLTFVVLGLPGLAIAIAVRLTLREPARERLSTAKDSGTSLSFAMTLKLLWSCRTYRLLMIYTVLNGFVQYGLNQWWPSFYSRVFQLPLSLVGIKLGIAIGVGSGVGMLIGGLMANNAARRDVSMPLLVGAAGVVLALPAALGSLFVSSAFVSLLLVALTAVFWSISNGPVVAIVYSVTAPRMRATAGAVSVFFASVLGFGLGPYCVGLASDFLTPSLGAQALRFALLVPISLLPLMVLALCAAAKGLRADLERVGAHAEVNSAASSPLGAGAAKLHAR